MTNWSALALARGLDIPADDLEGIAPSLRKLEEDFRPLLGKLPQTIEPAVILSEAAVLGK